jgi:hypothetical protein
MRHASDELQIVARNDWLIVRALQWSLTEVVVTLRQRGTSRLGM